VLNVAEETRRYKKTNKFPPKVLREATVMQYMIDARVDLTFEQMYQQLLLEPLYPNPFPRVTIILQSAWARHEFWNRSDADMEKELLVVKPEIANTKAFTYIARGGNSSEVFGTLAAVRIADSKKLCALYKALPELRNNTDVSSFKKSNKEQICTGFAGRTALEFRVAQHDEDLPSFIECHEHYVITGGQPRTSIRLFVEHVIMYASWLHMDTPHLVTRLSTGQIDPATGNSGTRANFNVSDLKKGSAAIRRELIRAANNNDGIFLHGLLRLDAPFTPRFVLLRKWFFFYWRVSEVQGLGVVAVVVALFAVEVVVIGDISLPLSGLVGAFSVCSRQHLRNPFSLFSSPFLFSFLFRRTPAKTSRSKSSRT
jgi:hypothetical protein